MIRECIKFVPADYIRCLLNNYSVRIVERGDGRGTYCQQCESPSAAVKTLTSLNLFALCGLAYLHSLPRMSCFLFFLFFFVNIFLLRFSLIAVPLSVVKALCFTLSNKFPLCLTQKRHTNARVLRFELRLYKIP